MKSVLVGKGPHLLRDDGRAYSTEVTAVIAVDGIDAHVIHQSSNFIVC